MGFVAQTRALAGKELRVIARDRQALLLLFGMPAVFILILSLAFAGIYRDEFGGSVNVVLDVRDRGEAAKRLERGLRSRKTFVFVDRAGETDPQRIFERDIAKAVITVPDGFSADLDEYVRSAGVEPFGPHRVTWESDPTLSLTYRWFFEAVVALAVQETVLDSLGGGSPEGRGAREFTVEADAERKASVIVPNPLQQNVPGWSLFAMFFIVVPMSGSFIAEIDHGTLRRLLTYPISRPALVLGKLLPYVAVNALQFVLMLLVGLLVVPRFSDLSLQLGRNAWVLIPVTLAAALAATGFGILVAALSRTTMQATTLGPTAIVILAALGGVMVPSFLMPDVLRTIGHVSPLYWGLEAYLDVFLRDAPFRAVLPELSILTAFAAACFAIAALRVRRT